jgi:hypothetical protein
MRHQVKGYKEYGQHWFLMTDKELQGVLNELPENLQYIQSDSCLSYYFILLWIHLPLLCLHHMVDTRSRKMVVLLHSAIVQIEPRNLWSKRKKLLIKCARFSHD